MKNNQPAFPNNAFSIADAMIEARAEPEKLDPFTLTGVLEEIHQLKLSLKGNQFDFYHQEEGYRMAIKDIEDLIVGMRDKGE